MRDLNETLIYLKVVERGSFTAAAREVALPKSTISRKVQELEKRLGVQLLYRTTRKLGTTEAGQVYFDLCRGIADELDVAESAVSHLQGAPRGWLRIGAPPTVASSCIAPILDRFTARYPDVRLEMRNTDGRPDLLSHELDIALVAGDLPDSSLAARRVARFRMSLFASSHYVARFGAPRHPDGLREHRVLALAAHRQGSRFEWRLTDGSHQMDLEIEPFLVCEDFAMLQGPLISGNGIALSCAFGGGSCYHAEGIQPVLPGWHGGTMDLHAVFPRSNMMSPKVRAFIDFLVEQHPRDGQ